MTRRIVAMALAVTLAAPAARAQSCTTGTSGNASCTVGTAVTATIDKVTQLEVTGGTTVSLGTLDAAAFAAGAWDAPTTITVTARANASWGATMAAATGAFQAPCSAKSVAALLWGRSSGTRTTALDPTPASVFPATSNAATAGASQVLFFRVQTGWTTDPPRQCAVGLSFALTAP